MGVAKLSITFFLQMADHPGHLPRRRLARAEVPRPAAGGRRDDRRRVPRPLAVRPAVSPDFQAASSAGEPRACSTSARSSASGSTCSWSAPRSGSTISRPRRQSAVGVSLAGIAAPFLVAIADHALAADRPRPVRAEALAVNATLFMGACIALTAFPMLARIINERGLTNTALGTLSLTAGAFDDAAAWCVLAIVLATFGAGAGVACSRSSAASLFALFMSSSCRSCSRRSAARSEATGETEQHRARHHADAVHACRPS